MKYTTDLRKIIKLALDQGCRVMEASGGKHPKIILPNKHVIGFSGSPRCPHAHKNLARDLKKAGLDMSSLHLHN